MKISLIGYTQLENFGDQFVGMTVDYLVKQYPAPGGINTKLFDFSFDDSKGKPSFLIRAVCKIHKLMGLKCGRDYLLVARYKSYYRKTLFREIADSDAIIFSCGSFKYGTQHLWVQYSLVVDYANRHNIPVMFDAMNVQKFDNSSFKCRYLKKHLNQKCVKYFTTRDGICGIERLKRDYLYEGTTTKVLPAADPAFWIPETYGIRRNPAASLIGINVIAPDRFQIYGGTLQPQDVKMAYIGMLNKLTERGLSWQLFTNGMQADKAFAIELAEYFNLPDDKLRIPKSCAELASMEANYRAVFGARLHSMICAYSFGVPVAGFIWDEKITHFAEMAQIEDLFLTESNVTGEAMFDVLMKALDRKDDPDNRNLWKETTKTTIFEFLADYCN